MQIREDVLVARCRAGDLEAFGQVYSLHERQVFRYAYHLLGNREDADDVKQETFLRAYQAIGSFRSAARLQTWLFRICGNLCRDRMKSWEHRNVCYDSSFPFEGVAESADPAAIVERAETKHIIFQVLHNLPPAHRAVIILHDIEELSYQEVAEVLECSTASAKLRVFRARRYLKERVTSLLKSRV